MPQGTRICKVCGKKYPYCKTNRPSSIFRFQDVACSPECGSIYFAQIEKSRSKNKVSKKTSSKAKKSAKVESPVIEDLSKDSEEGNKSLSENLDSSNEEFVAET